MPVLVSSDDSGAVGDGITNITRPHLLGTAEPGSTVQLRIAGSVVGTGTATVGGTYAIQLNAALSDGSYSITATATDAAGNISPAGAADALTIDTTAPAAPTLGLLAADDSGAVGDGITSVTRPRFTGSAEAGAVPIRLFLLGNLIGVGTSTGGTFTFAPDAALPEGKLTIVATAADSAGNISASASFSLTIDTTPPAAPAAPGLLTADDSGTVGDGITNVKRPHVSGTAESGSTVDLFIAGALVGVGTAVGGTYSILLNSALSDGTYSITASAIDAAGNAGPAGAPFTLTIDSTPPASPSAPGLLAADDSGVLGDGITNVRKPRFTGTAEAGATVNLFANGNLLGTGTATVGTFSITPTSALADGTYTITATATDAAGNVSAAGTPSSLTIDATQPAAPGAPTLLAADDSGALGDGITNDNTPRLTGTAEAGADHRPLRRRGGSSGTAVASGRRRLPDPGHAGADRLDLRDHRDGHGPRRKHERAERTLHPDDRFDAALRPLRAGPARGRRLGDGR